MSGITPELLLAAYAQGLFPMADSGESAELFWVDPTMRGVLPLDGFHVPRRLRRIVRQGRMQVRYDTAFGAVLDACAEPVAGRERTWINDEIRQLYGQLHDRGAAHCVECWRDGALVGGLYGVSLRGAFFGESMFSRVADASKVALVHLVAQLRHGGYVLLDAQFVTDHLRQFGCIEIPRAEYRRRLRRAMAVEAVWSPVPDAVTAFLDLPAADEPGEPA